MKKWKIKLSIICENSMNNFITKDNGKGEIANS